jgi:hypothetical protein
MQTQIIPVRIFISRAGNSTRLRLRDNRNNPDPVDFTDPELETAQGKMQVFDTNIEADDLIIWQLDPLSLTNPPSPGYSPIKSIDNIVQTFEDDGPQYKNSEPVLKSEPVSAGNSFVATVVTPSKGKGKFANYRIEFTLPNDTRHVHDPKLVFNT